MTIDKDHDLAVAIAEQAADAVNFADVEGGGSAMKKNGRASSRGSPRSKSPPVDADYCSLAACRT